MKRNQPTVPIYLSIQKNMRHRNTQKNRLFSSRALCALFMTAFFIVSVGMIGGGEAIANSGPLLINTTAQKSSNVIELENSITVQEILMAAQENTTAKLTKKLLRLPIVSLTVDSSLSQSTTLKAENDALSFLIYLYHYATNLIIQIFNSITQLFKIQPSKMTVALRAAACNPTEPIVGDDRPNNLSGEGRRFRYTIRGKGARDIISGNRCNDTLIGGTGNDELNGDNGDDELNGDNGNDELNGNNGNDVLNGNNGNDVLNGNNGDDDLDGGNGVDVLNGGNGNDKLFGRDKNDTLNGGDGNDNLSGQDNDDTLRGGDGDDDLFGNDHDDRLIGGEGVDWLSGGPGSDTLIGDCPNDMCNKAKDYFFLGGNDDKCQSDSNIECQAAIEDLHAGGVMDEILYSDPLCSRFDEPVNPDICLSDSSLITSRFTTEFLTEQTSESSQSDFIYDRSTGNLYFDPDGRGTQDPNLIATLPPELDTKEISIKFVNTSFLVKEQGDSSEIDLSSVESEILRNLPVRPAKVISLEDLPPSYPPNVEDISDKRKYDIGLNNKK